MREIIRLIRESRAGRHFTAQRAQRRPNGTDPLTLYVAACINTSDNQFEESAHRQIWCFAGGPVAAATARPHRAVLFWAKILPLRSTRTLDRLRSGKPGLLQAIQFSRHDGNWRRGAPIKGVLLSMIGSVCFPDSSPALQPLQAFQRLSGLIRESRSRPLSWDIRPIASPVDLEFAV